MNNLGSDYDDLGYKKSQSYSKKHKILVSFIVFFLFVDSILLYGLYSIHYKHKEPSIVTHYKYSIYESYSEKFSKDPIILDISSYCSESEDPIRCVFYKISMDYDYNRTIYPIFRTPEEYFEVGGVCRDYSLLRHSALRNLGVNCIFDFSQSNHVFLDCSYDNKIYVLNNNFLKEW